MNWLWMVACRQMATWWLVEGLRSSPDKCQWAFAEKAAVATLQVQGEVGKEAGVNGGLYSILRAKLVL